MVPTAFSNPHAEYPRPGDPDIDQDFFLRLPPLVQDALDRVKAERTFQHRDFLYHQGEPVDAVYQLLDGEWKILRGDARGRYQVLQFLGPGSVIGIIPVTAGAPAFYGVQAKGRCRCSVIPGEAFRSVVLGDPEGLEAALRHFGRRVRHLADIVEGLSLHSVPERVAWLLVSRQKLRPGSRLVEFEEDQDELGHHLGCTRCAFNRAMRFLSGMGLIRSTFPVVSILDLPALERFAGGGAAKPGGASPSRGSPGPGPSGIRPR